MTTGQPRTSEAADILAGALRQAAEDAEWAREFPGSTRSMLSVAEVSAILADRERLAKEYEQRWQEHLARSA